MRKSFRRTSYVEHKTKPIAVCFRRERRRRERRRASAVGVSRPEVLPNKQRGPSPGVFPRLGPFLYSTPFFFISNAERWLPVFRKFFACFRRASPMERKANSSQFAFVGNTVGAKRRCASAVGAEGTVCARRRRGRHCVPAVGAEGTVCPP